MDKECTYLPILVRVVIERPSRMCDSICLPCLQISKTLFIILNFSSFLTISNQKTAFFDLKGRKSCQLCPGAFTSDLAYYYHHFRSHRPKSEILDCKVCGKTAKNMMMFKRHVLGWDFSNKLTAIPPVDLYLIFEKLIWKNQV